MTFETSALYNRVDAHGADLLVNVVSLATYEGATPVTAEGVVSASGSKGRKKAKRKRTVAGVVMPDNAGVAVMSRPPREPQPSRKSLGDPG